MAQNQPSGSLGTSESTILGKRLSKDTGLVSSEQKCAELAPHTSAEGMMQANSSCLPVGPPPTQRFKSLTATHTPGTLELNMTGQVQSDAIPQQMVSQQELAVAGQQVSAPQSISASIAANGKDTDLNGAKTAGKGSKAGAGLDSPIKEKRGRPGRPPKHSKASKDTLSGPSGTMDSATL